MGESIFVYKKSKISFKKSIKIDKIFFHVVKFVLLKKWTFKSFLLDASYEQIKVCNLSIFNITTASPAHAMW